MTREEAIKALKWFKEYDGGDYDGGEYDGGDRIIDKYGDCYYLVTERDFEAFDMAIKALEQEPKIKVLDRDEAIRKLGAVDIYQASAWITLLNDLEYLKLKICEVEE